MTEPDAGLDTTRITTFATRRGSDYVVRGRKVWISKAVESEKILLLTRTTPRSEVERPTDGLTLFFTDLDRDKVSIRPIPKIGRNAVTSNELVIDDLVIPESHRVGEEGKGFTYILDGLNPERMLIAAEALGIGRAALAKATVYAKERVVFDRPLGMNQGSSSRWPTLWRSSMPRNSPCARPPGPTIRACRAVARRTPRSTCARRPGTRPLTGRSKCTAGWGTRRSTTWGATSVRSDSCASLR